MLTVFTDNNRLDSSLLAAAGALLVLGLLMVGSASMPVAEHNAGQPFYYLFRQAAYVVVALVFAFMILRWPLERWFSWHLVALIAVLALLVLVLVFGREVNGSTRWLRFGAINVQVSELAKLCAIIYFAGYLRRYKRVLATSMLAMFRPVIILGLLAFLLLLEPDFGAAAVLVATGLGMLFLAGVHLLRFAGLLTLTGLAMSAALLSSAYRRERLVSFLDPWNDPFGSGFQLVQSLIAVGRGELSGVGLGASVQKLFYLPEAYTDFLFAILAEELGLIGILVVIALYAVIVWRAFAIAAYAEWLQRWFAAYLAYGIGLLFALQALVNMGVTLGVLPTKGLTLPLMSYGGSSMIVMVAALALLLRCDLENRQNDPRLQRRQGNGKGHGDGHG